MARPKVRVWAMQEAESWPIAPNLPFSQSSWNDQNTAHALPHADKGE